VSETDVLGEAPILVVFAHPAFRASRVNRALADAVRDLPGVYFHDLLEAYPDFYIDVVAEQRRLRAARLVVLQHPLYWYSAPAIVKHWIDEVLVTGFAYGEGGEALAGKDLLQVVSTGAPWEAYRAEGRHGYPLSELLRPLEQTARFCRMRYLRPLVVPAGRALDDAALARCALGYRALLEGYPSTGRQPLAVGARWEDRG
jgi:putative NADPH-quinone reductase